MSPSRRRQSSRLAELKAKTDARRKDADSDAARIIAKRTQEHRELERQLEDSQSELCLAKLQVAQLSAELDEARHAAKAISKAQPDAGGGHETATPAAEAAKGTGFFRRRKV